MKQADALHNNF